MSAIHGKKKVNIKKNIYDHLRDENKQLWITFIAFQVSLLQWRRFIML